ncbi:hypothetical protein DXG01_014686 [Tephrocybe rancida]|nr:hypothetical protein DXG01_014686 [Tephrocybe rancida]
MSLVEIEIVWSFIVTLIMLDLGALTMKWAVILDFGTTSLIDFILCILLIYALAKVGRKLDWTDTSAIVVAAYAVNTGAIAALNARFYFQRSEGLVSVTLSHGHGSVFLYDTPGPQSRIPPTSNNRNHVTINEAGLPLFKSKNEANQIQPRLKEIQVLEVKVTKEQAEV